MSTIPIRREEITAEWLAGLLAEVGECDISRLELEKMTGYNPDLSQLFRARISYTSRSAEHPDTVIVKIPPEDDETRLREAAHGPYASELGSYRMLESFQGRSLAKMFGTVEDLEERTACFVFEDLGVFREGQKYAKIDLDIAKSALDFMASYQARYWQDDSLGSAAWIRDADWSFLFNQDPLDSIPGWQVIRDDNRFEKTDGLIVAGEYLGERLNRLRDALRSRPNTLTHNDFHQGNVLLRDTPNGPLAVIIDWQMPAYAGGTNDLAKFLMTAVPFDILAEHEGDLVAHYTDNLKANDVIGYSLDECWRDYRRAQIATFGNYAIGCYETSPDGGLIESSGDSTHAVIKALTLADADELREILP
jgi:hypothetical protein